MSFVSHWQYLKPVFDTSRTTSVEKCAVKGKRLKPSLSEEPIPNFHNMPANILNEPAMHNKVRVRRWQQNGNFTLVERGRSWMPPLAQSDARSLHELRALCITQNFGISSLPLSLQSWFCLPTAELCWLPIKKGNFWRRCFTAIISIFKLDLSFLHSKIPPWGLSALSQSTV